MQGLGLTPEILALYSLLNEKILPILPGFTFPSKLGRLKLPIAHMERHKLQEHAWNLGVGLSSYTVHF